MQNPNNINDRRLIGQIRAGNQKAFRIFIEKYQRLVSHVVFRMVPNPADREDVCQTVFLKIFQNVGGFRFESKTSTWVAKIAHNTCVNYLQKKKIPLFEDCTSKNVSIETVSGDRTRPDRITEEGDIASRLQEEIDRLDAPFRTILALYHVDEMSYAEISRIMDLPEGTVKSYLFRARKRLKERLMSKYRREEIWHTCT